MIVKMLMISHCFLELLWRLCSSHSILKYAKKLSILQEQENMVCYILGSTQYFHFSGEGRSFTFSIE